MTKAAKKRAAVVFDSAGTLLCTRRCVLQLPERIYLGDDVETTALTFADEARVLVVLDLGPDEILEALEDELLSKYLKNHGTSFVPSFSKNGCGQNIFDAVREVLLSDGVCRMGDLQKAILPLRGFAPAEFEKFVLNAGVIVNLMSRAVEFVIASAGFPFPGVKPLLASLKKSGIETFIASGDRTEKLCLAAKRLGILQENVCGMASPEKKAEFVSMLKKRYEKVVMVGDGINDLKAFLAADASVLSEEQSAEKPPELRRAADFVVKKIEGVEEVVRRILH